MIDQHNQTHLFSLYAPNLINAAWTVGANLIISEENLVHRIVKVLRFDVGHQFVLFDQGQHALVSMQQVSKKDIKVCVKSVEQHKALQPEVTFFLPLLKKEALEESVYSLCELGINKIQLISTQKSRQELMGPKELVRLQNIVIAAAEQSKNYALAELLPVKKLSDVMSLVSQGSLRIVFDAAGGSFFDLREKTEEEPVTLLVGPEGGLTQSELQSVQQHKFHACALTATTLRAVQAVALGAGLIRLK